MSCACTVVPTGRGIGRSATQARDKMLLVCMPAGLDKQGVRNEIEIGAQLARELNDREHHSPPARAVWSASRIVQAQYVDFSHSRAAGLAELVDLLVNVHISHGVRPGQWRTGLRRKAWGSRLVERPEQLTSNWLIFADCHGSFATANRHRGSQ